MDTFARPQRLVRIGRRRRLNLHVSGEGTPTVLLFAGGGCTTFHWSWVQRSLARTCRVVSSDRAGTGFSDPGPLPRTTSRLVADLRAALSAAAIGPPYVLVCHSMGSFDGRLFAFLNPEEVVGMVLVDPRPDRSFELVTAAAPSLAPLFLADLGRLRRNATTARRRPQPGTSDYEALAAKPDPHLSDAMNRTMLEQSLRPSFWRTIASEQGSLLNGASQAEIDTARRPLGDLPLIVLATGKNAPDPGLTAGEAAAVEAAHKAGNLDLVRLSTRGERREVPDASHSIPWEKPRPIVEAVLEIISAAKIRS